ncbi:hypothetical protein F5Y17DRAFT_72315 [Xylariaceae sp. FL0594]|nr:hypothetical protein F5Y17DRAFT_72315 [Xylariaceae sp. FL0594]
MGAKASKPAQTAARKFPTRAPGSAVPPSARAAAPRPGAGAGSQAQAARGGAPRDVKDDAIHKDGSDPDFDLNALADKGYAERLRQMGVATPYPTLSNSSTAGPYANPTPSTPGHPSFTPVDFDPHPHNNTSSPPPSSSSSDPAPAPSTYTEISHSLNQPPSSPSKTKVHPPQPQQQNRTLSALEARAKFQQLAEKEFEDPSKGREFLDAGTLRRALLLRKRGVRDAEIEKRLNLKSGVVARMGPPGVAVPVDAAGLNRQTWGGLSE